MPTPHKFRLTLAHTYAPYLIESYEFEAWPSASCTLAQHNAAKLWYLLQSKLDPADAKEASLSETRSPALPQDQ